MDIKMRSMVLALVVLLGCGGNARGTESVEAPSGTEIRWNPISGTSGYRGEGSGDPRSEAGATLSIDSMGSATGPFGGVIASLDLASYRGHEIELSAAIEVLEGAGSAAVWVRADGDRGRPAFATSGASPVVKGAAQDRRIRLYVPMDSTALVLGAIVQGEANARITRVRVEVMPAVKSDVSAHDVLESAFALVEKHALNASRADLAALRKSALTAGLREAPPMQAYAPIAELLEALGDGHSFVLPPAQAEQRRGAGMATGTIESRLIGKVGYIAVPGFVGTGAEDSTRFVRDICGALTAHAAGASAGWVVDLRGNTGGNMWPMLGGLKPLLGTEPYGSFRDRDGRHKAWELGKSEGCSAPIPPDARVAVLIGPRTASSGEAVVIAFSGRPNARSFGSNTAGVSTSNLSLGLPDGGALFLTNAIGVDRVGMAFPAGVSPDVSVAQEAPADGALDAALAWLGRP